MDGQAIRHLIDTRITASIRRTPSTPVALHPHWIGKIVASAVLSPMSPRAGAADSNTAENFHATQTRDRHSPPCTPTIMRLAQFTSDIPTAAPPSH